MYYDAVAVFFLMAKKTNQKIKCKYFKVCGDLCPSICEHWNENNPSFIMAAVGGC